MLFVTSAFEMAFPPSEVASIEFRSSVHNRALDKIERVRAIAPVSPTGLSQKSRSPICVCQSVSCAKQMSSFVINPAASET